MSSENSVESLGTLQWDIMELANHLRQERLFVTSEQQNLQILNEKVSNNKKKRLKIKTIYGKTDYISFRYYMHHQIWHNKHGLQHNRELISIN